jgi:hypothetical protein
MWCAHHRSGYTAFWQRSCLRLLTVLTAVAGLAATALLGHSFAPFFEDVANGLFLLERHFSLLGLSCHCKDIFQCYLVLVEVKDLLLEHRVLTVLDEEKEEPVSAC